MCDWLLQKSCVSSIFFVDSREDVYMTVFIFIKQQREMIVRTDLSTGADFEARTHGRAIAACLL